MKLTIEVNLEVKDEADLQRILGQETDKKWPAGFAPYATAAAEEYVRMFLGQKVFTRGSDVREYRLFLLIRTAFANQIPDEPTVCALFQCTLSQSRALLRAVMSKYQYELSKAISSTLKEVLLKAKENKAKGTFILAVNNESVVAELNKVLARQPGQDEIARQTGKLGTYELQPAAYELLREHFEKASN